MVQNIMNSQIFMSFGKVFGELFGFIFEFFALILVGLARLLMTLVMYFFTNYPLFTGIVFCIIMILLIILISKHFSKK